MRSASAAIPIRPPSAKRTGNGGMIAPMESALLTEASFTAIILLGFIVARTMKLPKGFADAISRIVFTFTLPCAIFHAFVTSNFDASLLMLTFIGVVCTFVPWLIGTVLTWKEDRDHRVLMMMNISGFNIGCFALPFVQALFPPGAALVVCLFDAGNALMMSGGTYAFSSALLDKGGSHTERVVLAAKRLFSSVPFDLYIVLIILAVIGVKIPDPVVHFLEPISNANAFLSMFMLGLMVQFSLDKAKIGQLVRLLGMRFALSALIGAGAIFLLPFDPLTCAVVAALIWAPMGSLGPVYTMWAKGDVGLAGFANVVTIVVGIVAITAIALIAA